MKAIVILVAIATAAHAEPVTLGLFAPTAPFASTSARVELASRLGDALGKGASTTGTGKVYARAGDFAAAVKRGDLAVALVDAGYLARTSGYTVIAASLAHGDADQTWQLIARGGLKLADLRGKRVLVPSNGGHETDFVLNVLLGGEVPRDFFAKIEAAPDTAAAIAALGLGKADAAVVPAGSELPAGTTPVITLPAIAGPTLVAYGTLSAAQRAQVAAALASWRGDATVAALAASNGDAVRAITRRFSIPPKRGPFAVPGARLVVGDLVEGRTFTIERTPPTAFAVAPGK